MKRFVLFAFLSLIACGAQSVERGDSRVWSTASSNDGLAACPSSTTVTGGGFEIKESDRAAGRVPLVLASRPEGNGWRVICVDPGGATSPACRAWAVCASVLAR